MKKRSRENLKQEPHGLGPLAWLAGFTSFGLSHLTPRPAFPKARESRFLGIDARHKGYALDPKSHREIEPINLPGYGRGEIVRQRHRNMVKQFFKPAGSEELIPFVLPTVSETDPAKLARHLAEHPPRSIMPETRYGTVFLSAADLLREEPPSPELTPRAAEVMLRVQAAARNLFLHYLWLRERHAGGPYATWRLQWTLRCVLVYCAGVEVEHKEPPPDDDPVMTATVDREIRALSARIWREGPRGTWLGQGLIAILWAEVANSLLHDRASWPLLRCCGCCSKYWLVVPGRRGRPQDEFCSDACGKWFHDYGFADRRYRRKA